MTAPAASTVLDALRGRVRALELGASSGGGPPQRGNQARSDVIVVPPVI